MMRIIIIPIMVYRGVAGILGAKAMALLAYRRISLLAATIKNITISLMRQLNQC